MGAFAVSYKLEFVFVGVSGAGLAKVFRGLESDIDLPVRRVYDGTNRQPASIVRDPDRHVAFAFDETVRPKYLGLDSKTPLLSEDGFLLFPGRDAHGNFVNQTGIADRHSK